MKISSVLFALPLALAACGGDDGDPIIEDIDSGVAGPDACVSTKPSAPGAVSIANRGDRLHLSDTVVAHGGCGATASYGAAATTMPLANGEHGDVCDDTSPAGFIGYQALLNNDATPDVLDIELYKGYGAFTTGEIRPGTYAITGDETQYADCGVCVLILADADAQGNPGSLYLATGGSVTITSVSPNITGTMSNMTFTHVDIVDTVSTPNADACPSAITSASFDALVEFP